MYQKLIIVGRATANAKRKKSKKGDMEYTTFGVAVNEGKDRTTFFDVSVFGSQGKPVAEFVTKGRLVTVEGRINKSDKGFFNVVADRVVFGPQTESSKKTNKARR